MSHLHRTDSCSAYEACNAGFAKRQVIFSAYRNRGAFICEFEEGAGRLLVIMFFRSNLNYLAKKKEIIVPSIKDATNIVVFVNEVISTPISRKLS